MNQSIAARAFPAFAGRVRAVLCTGLQLPTGDVPASPGRCSPIFPSVGDYGELNPGPPLPVAIRWGRDVVVWLDRINR